MTANEYKLKLNFKYTLKLFLNTHKKTIIRGGESLEIKHPTSIDHKVVDKLIQFRLC